MLVIGFVVFVCNCCNLTHSFYNEFESYIIEARVIFYSLSQQCGEPPKRIRHHHTRDEACYPC